MSSIVHISDSDPRGDIRENTELGEMSFDSQDGSMDSLTDEQSESDSFLIFDEDEDHSRYIRPDFPDVLNHRQDLPDTIQDLKQITSYNDFYLNGIKPNQFFADSIEATTTMYESLPVLSSQDEDGTVSETAEHHVFKHAHLEGGHGLSQIYNKPIQHNLKMSEMNQVSCTSGCVGLCAFCKESNSNRSLNAASLFYNTQTFQIRYGDKVFECNSDTRVQAYDPETQTIVALPIRNAIRLKLPVRKRHLEWLAENNPLAVRVLSD